MALKRILWLTENYPPQRGGMAQSCDRIIYGLRELGYQIDVIHFTSRHTQFYETNIVLNGSYTAIPYEESEGHTLNRCWLHIKNRECPNLVLCFGGYLSMLAAPVFSKWLQVPLYTLIRGNDFDQSLFTPRKRFILDELIKSSVKVGAVSSEKKEKIALLYPDTEVHFTPNGIDIENWLPDQSDEKRADTIRLQFPEEHICVAVIGDLKAKKGVNFLVEALVNSLQVKWHFMLIGEIDEALTTMLQAHQQSYQQHPFLDRYELLPFYLAADVIAIPSFYDGMPNVILEAGALATPVIASDVDGMADVIINEGLGLLFRAGDQKDCRRTFLQFASMPIDERTILGQNLQKHISAHYHAKNEIEIYHSFFNN